MRENDVHLQAGGLESVMTELGDQLGSSRLPHWAWSHLSSELSRRRCLAGELAEKLDHGAVGLAQLDPDQPAFRVPLLAPDRACGYPQGSIHRLKLNLESKPGVG
jgi:hypothetical protein